MIHSNQFQAEYVELRPAGDALFADTESRKERRFPLTGGLWYYCSMATDPSEIRLSLEQCRRLARHADKAGMPWPDFLEQLIPAPAEIDPEGDSAGLSAFDLAEQLGLIGISDQGPPDLATHPKYMEGFGESDNLTSTG
jgi:hypothetical protein